MSNQILFDLGRPMIMAHRGDPSSAPENTMKAMKSAIDVGVDLLETDIRLTKDNEFVLFHDEELSRTTGQEGTIGDYTLDELMDFDIGYNYSIDNGTTFPFRGKGLKIVMLQKALESFPDMKFNIDIKDKEKEAPELLTQLIREQERQPSVIVASFHERQLQRFRVLMSEVATSAHPGEVSRFVFALKGHVLPLFVRKPHYQAFQVPMKYESIKVVDSRFVKAAHDRNIAVHVWTINDRPIIENLIDLGVNGIFTDRPKLMREILQERGLL